MGRFDLQLLKVLFPNGDQRNTLQSLSKAKRKVLLLQRGKLQTSVS
jgi:hypothetical protein